MRVYQGCFIKAFSAENFGLINSSAPAEVSQFKNSAQKSINLHGKYVYKSGRRRAHWWESAPTDKNFN